MINSKTRNRQKVETLNMLSTLKSWKTKEIIVYQDGFDKRKENRSKKFKEFLNSKLKPVFENNTFVFGKRMQDISASLIVEDECFIEDENYSFETNIDDEEESI